MNFFKLYVGDYQRDTAHLSVTEHGAYLLMLQHYYATERPLPTGKALHRMLRAQDKVEREAIDSVVEQYWVEEAEGLINARARQEIAKSDHQRSVNREVGKRGGRPKRTETESVSKSVHESVHESEPNDNPNQTPDTRHQRSNTPPLTPPGGVHDDACPPLPAPENPPKRAAVHEFPPGFDRFWQAYPRKTAKPHAAKAFARLRPDEALLERMLQALQAQRSSPQWQRDGGQFIPHPATWLNGRRWEDQLPLATGTDDAFAGAL